MADFGNDLRTAYDEGYEDGLQDAVKHGRWIKCSFGSSYTPLYECSNCGKHWHDDMNFCGECGAKMDLPKITNRTAAALEKIGKNAHGGTDNG